MRRGVLRFFWLRIGMGGFPIFLFPCLFLTGFLGLDADSEG